MFTPLTFKSGLTMPNRFMLAPLTNLQSHEDGRLSDDEFNWLTMRAKGGFGLTMTCAAFAEETGKGFPGQLGVCDDSQLDGLTRLASGIKEQGSLAFMQVVHGGMRTLKQYTGQDPVCPSDDEETGARAMTLDEIKATHDSFVNAALRMQKAGFDGMEIHAAHGYLLCEFISPEINKRTDDYGGPLENRTRLIDDIIRDIRAACGSSFGLGVRLSPNRFGMQIEEVAHYFERLCAGGLLDFIDMSLWNVFEEVSEGRFQGQRLIDIFASIDRGDTLYTPAGFIRSGADVQEVMSSGADFVTIGRAAILHHDFPVRYRNDNNFCPKENPVSRQYLEQEGLGPKFIDYMATWDGFVAD